MKNLFLTILTFSSFLVSTAQEVSSLYFSSPQPGSAEVLKEIPEEFIGGYRSKKDTLKNLIITSDSIFVDLITPVVMSRSEVLANTDLHLRDSFLYGIYKDRPIQVVLKNDTVIFAIESRHVFYRPGKNTVLKSCGNDLLISTKNENGYWSVMRLSLIRKDEVLLGFTLSYVDHEIEMDLINKQKGLKRTKHKGETIYLLDLNETQMNEFIAENGFNIPENYFFIP